ncbi:MAG: YciI family protein [Bauldia sp.]
MKYLCQVYLEERTMKALSKGELATLDHDSVTFDKELQRSGYLIVAEALQSPDTATTVRVRDGKVSVTDGPFAETKEHLGGFLLIEARDLNDAIRVAAGVPIAKFGSIEVRPIYEVPGRETQ